MGAFLDYAKQFKSVENPAIADFSKAMHKQWNAFKSGEMNRRSWVKRDGEEFTLKLGKLDDVYRLPNEDEVNQLFARADHGLKNDKEFIALIEAAYGGEATVEKPKRGRRAVRLDD